MLKKVDDNIMYNFLREIYPTAEPNALMNKAKENIEGIDSVFDDIIFNYCKDGTLTEYTHGEFCLSLIMALCDCSYPQAIILMDEYIKKPLIGKAKILRR